MSEFTTIKVDVSDDAFVVTLNRPASRNAISLLMMHELVAAVADASARRASMAVIVTGGAEFFSSGRDLKEVAATTSRQGAEEARAAWLGVTESFERCPKPVIAAIEGSCLTGGLELALACDLRVAGDGATFGVTSARLGTMPAFGATQRLPRLVGASRAMEMMFLAETIGVDDAQRIGLINRRAERGGAVAEARRLAATIAERAPLSIAAMKKAVHEGLSMPLGRALELELSLGATLAGSSDRREGIAAFAEKRRPRFTGE